MKNHSQNTFGEAKRISLLPKAKPTGVGLLILAMGLCLQSYGQQRTTGGGGGSRSGTTRTYPSNGSIGDAYFSIDPETRRVVTIADEDTSQYISQVLSN